MVRAVIHCVVYANPANVVLVDGRRVQDAHKESRLYPGLIKQ